MLFGDTSNSCKVIWKPVNCIGDKTEGYSGSDKKELVKDASFGPIRELNFEEITNISSSQVRKVVLNDFLNSLNTIRPSVSQNDLQDYIEWNKTYGSINWYSFFC